MGVKHFRGIAIGSVTMGKNTGGVQNVMIFDC